MATKRTRNRRRPAPSLPRSIRLGYRPITIRKSRDISNASHGEYQADKKLILLNPDSCTGEDGVNTLVHEVMHACFDLAQLHHSELSREQNREHEEKLVTVLANQLTEAFKRNPKLLAWIEAELGL